MVSPLALREGIGLRLAARLGHGFREVGKQHREPQPERDLEDLNLNLYAMLDGVLLISSVP